MLVDQEDNPDQSRSFEGDDVLIGKEWQEVFQCKIYFKAALGLLISCNTKHILHKDIVQKKILRVSSKH